MKQIFFKAMAVILGLAISVAFTSCNNNKNTKNNESEEPQNKYTNLIVDYSVKLSEDYLYLWDIEVTYTNLDGQSVTETLGNPNWSKTLTLDPTEEIPTTYALTVIRKPKSQVPDLDDTKAYTLADDISLTANWILKDGTESIIGNKDGNSSLTVKGDKLKDAVTEQRTIFDQEITVNK